VATLAQNGELGLIPAVVVVRAAQMGVVELERITPATATMAAAVAAAAMVVVVSAQVQPASPEEMAVQHSMRPLVVSVLRTPLQRAPRGRTVPEVAEDMATTAPGWPPMVALAAMATNGMRRTAPAAAAGQRERVRRAR